MAKLALCVYLGDCLIPGALPYLQVFLFHAVCCYCCFSDECSHCCLECTDGIACPQAKHSSQGSQVACINETEHV
jgi:hypothetical protein